MRRLAWTPQADEDLRQYAAKNNQLPALAFKLKRSRSSVASRAQKLKIEISGFTRGHNLKKGHPNTGLKRSFRLKETIPLDRYFNPDGISFLLVRDAQCRWLLAGRGSDGHPRCCGKGVAGEGISWCNEHALRCFEPPREKRVSHATP